MAFHGLKVVAEIMKNFERGYIRTVFYGLTLIWISNFDRENLCQPQALTLNKFKCSTFPLFCIVPKGAVSSTAGTELSCKPDICPAVAQNPQNNTGLGQIACSIDKGGGSSKLRSKKKKNKKILKKNQHICKD